VTPEHHHELEILAQIARMEGCRFYLEIGSRFGISLDRIARAMPVGSRIVSIDLPGGAWGHKDSHSQLEEVCGALRASGYDVHLHLGDSTDPEIIEAVRALGPYGLCYIDGDHRYEGVEKDWLNYGPMCRLVSFDDIWTDRKKKFDDGFIHAGVFRLWSEIRKGKRYLEIAGTEKRTQGIGVLWNG